MRTSCVLIFCMATFVGVSGCNSPSPISVVPTPPTGPVKPAPPNPPSTPAAVQAFEALTANPNSTNIKSAVSGSSVVVLTEGVAGDGTIEVTVGATLYKLDGSIGSGIPIFTDNSTGTRVSVARVAEDSDVALALIRTGNGTVTDRTGFSALGAKTSSADLANLVGVAGASAFYTGTSSLVAMHENNLRDSADGDLQMLVDFENSTFMGSMDLSSNATGGTNFEIGDVNALISNGTISNNVLMADVEVLTINSDPNFPNGANQLGMDTLAPESVGKLTGSFYGANAKNVSGTFNFSGTEPVRQGFNAQKIEVQGGFIGIKQ